MLLKYEIVVGTQGDTAGVNFRFFSLFLYFQVLRSFVVTFFNEIENVNTFFIG